MTASTRLALLASALALSACQNRPLAPMAGSGTSLQAAREALNGGEAGTSLAIARGVLISQPNNVAALVQAGDAQTVLGDRLAAQISYQKALAVAPRDVHARLGMGKLQIRDDLHQAEATFRGILADAPRDPLALNDLGYTLDLQERHAEAQAYYQQAIAADPARISSRVNLALSLSLSGHAAQAEQMLRDVAADNSTVRRVRVDYAVAQVMAGHDKDAAMTLSSDLSPPETESAIAGLVQLRPATLPPK